MPIWFFGRDVLIIPWRVDVPQDRWPVTNWLIIGVNIALFAGIMTLLILGHSTEQRSDEEVSEIAQLIKPYVFDGITLKGLFGHMWLHGGILHLAGNMLFLWIFGNAVCAKIGNMRYLSLYVFLGLIAAFAHLIFRGGAMIGASGAIMGVVGMYLVFFPENDITCYFIWILFFRPIIREFTLSSYWMILFWIAFDIWGATKAGGGVAYFAHLGGFATGIALAVLMLKMKWVQMAPRYEKSLLDMLSKKKEPDEFKPIDPTYTWLMEQAAETENPNPQKKPPAENSNYRRQTAERPEGQSGQMIRFVCPCGKHIKVAGKYAGRVGKCPNCKKRLKVPEKG